MLWLVVLLARFQKNVGTNAPADAITFLWDVVSGVVSTRRRFTREANVNNLPTNKHSFNLCLPVGYFHF